MSISLWPCSHHNRAHTSSYIVAQLHKFVLYNSAVIGIIISFIPLEHVELLLVVNKCLCLALGVDHWLINQNTCL